MLLHFDFEPQVPAWPEFQQALETIAGQKVSMTGGPSSGGGAPRWTARVSGLAGQLVLEYQREVEGGVVVHASEAHRSFVEPLVGAFGGTRRSPRLEARVDRDVLDYSNGPNLYSPEWYELTTADACFKLDAGFLSLLFGDEPQGLIGRLLELEADELDDTVALSPLALGTLLDQLHAPRSLANAAGDRYLLEDLECCREDLCSWLEARQQAESTVTAKRCN